MLYLHAKINQTRFHGNLFCFESYLGLWSHQHNKHNIRDKSTIMALKSCYILKISQKRSIILVALSLSTEYSLFKRNSE